MKDKVGASFFLVLCLCIQSGASPLSRRGAGVEVKIPIRIIDEQGLPIPYSQVLYSMSRGLERYEYFQGTADKDGCFSIAGSTRQFLCYSARHDGYYDSGFKVDCLNSSTPQNAYHSQTAKTMVLKKVGCTDEIVPYQYSNEVVIPKFDKWLSFDFERLDWLPPYGNGICQDVLLRFLHTKGSNIWESATGMEVCFTNNQFAGAYLMKKDKWSRLKSEHHASTNKMYHSILEFNRVSHFDWRTSSSNYLDDDHYLVFRTRTKVDEKGNLIGAHYGKIYGRWTSNNKVMLFSGGCFNTVENSTNIESDQEVLDYLKNQNRPITIKTRVQ